jgi:hypothetical protein
MLNIDFSSVVSFESLSFIALPFAMRTNHPAREITAFETKTTDVSRKIAKAAAFVGICRMIHSSSCCRLFIRGLRSLPLMVKAFSDSSGGKIQSIIE